ncbi:MAG: sigma-70 family RNA polymerase sigma factor [Planctomycetes bacterium]|nr:sigma-70 family RNA polymerase sigma factor [Planctomycetota bacterium]
MDTSQELDLDYLQNRVSFYARSLIGSYGITEDDIEDIQQDIFCIVWPSLENFDGKKSCQHTYITCLVERAQTSIIRKRTAQKRTLVHMQSLSEFDIASNDDSDTDFEHTQGCLIDEDAEKVYGRVDLTNDLKDIMQALSPLERRICLKLKTQAIHVTAQELSLTRHTLNQHLESIKKVFVEHGLDGAI